VIWWNNEHLGEGQVSNSGLFK